MSTGCLDIQKKVLEILTGDTTLNEYVKAFSIGEENIARMTFPWVSVVNVTFNVEPQCIGPNAKAMYRYTITIKAGTNSLCPEFAYAGDESGAKGIVQLVDDIVNCIYPGNLDGIFKRSMRLANAVCADDSSSAGRTWRGTIILEGFLSA